MWCGSCNTASNTVETAKFTYRKEAGNDPLKSKIKQKVVVNCPFIYKEALRFKCVAFGKTQSMQQPDSQMKLYSVNPIFTYLKSLKLEVIEFQ